MGCCGGVAVDGLLLMGKHTASARKIDFILQAQKIRAPRR